MDNQVEVEVDDLRKIANGLLRDEHGITTEVWEVLRKQLINAGIYDEFRSKVDATDGYFYIDPSFYPEE